MAIQLQLGLLRLYFSMSDLPRGSLYPLTKTVSQIFPHFSEMSAALLLTPRASQPQFNCQSRPVLLLLDGELQRISLNWWVNQASCWACKSMCLLSFSGRINGAEEWAARGTNKQKRSRRPNTWLNSCYLRVENVDPWGDVRFLLV